MKKQIVKSYKTTSSGKEKAVSAGLVAACIAAAFITITAVSLLSDTVMETKRDSIPDTPVAAADDNLDEVSSKPRIEEKIIEVDPPTQTSEPVDEVNETTEETIEVSSSPITYSAPLSGGVLKEFSNHIPLYSETLEDWRVHNGVDIAAPLGAEVCAVADGVISNTTNDFRYGFTITIDHENGIKSTYSNLSGTDMVRIGKNVKKGEVISTVGDTALFETADDTHLHIEMTLDDEYVNPADYFVIK
ncbi:MAG: M23 family metallopeptidase [Clostridia bacterium]|nr:M23 family metallopeptidase [Clostridia bacterium]